MKSALRLMILTLLATALLPVPALVDAVSGELSVSVELTRSLGYLVGAPLFGAWDALMLQSASQHYAILLSIVATYALGRAWCIRVVPGVGRPAVDAARRVRREVVVGAGASMLLLLFYLGGAFLPRPMVGLVVTDPDMVAVDFHSHTRHSHDGLGFFSHRRNRAWHAAGGFDVAYLTDHYTWEGFHEARAENPAQAGEGVALLSGAEIRIHGRPTNILGSAERYLSALDEDSVYLDPEALRATPPGPAVSERPPTLLFTLPGPLDVVFPYSADRPAGYVALELSDGSPRGLEQSRRDRAAIIALADSLDLALLGVSNAHGYGRTVASWSVLQLPGWRGTSMTELADGIERVLHQRRRNAVRVFERSVPYHHGSSWLLALTGPRLLLHVLRALSLGERVSWLLWATATLFLLHRRETRAS